MQLSWGNKLVLVFMAFAVLIGTLVYNCMQQNFELVSPDYYDQELKYQDRINATANANKLSTVHWSQTENDVVLTLPAELNGLPIQGEVWFYCAANSRNDRKLAIKVNNEGQMQIPKNKLAKDHYQLKLSWKNGTNNFYNEQYLQVK